MPTSAELGINRSGNRLNDSHTICHSLVDRGVSNTVILNPGGEGFGHSSNFDKSRIAPVNALLGPRRPPAVFCAVVPVRVNAVNGVFRRRGFAHVGKEIFKGKPAVANRYSAPTVVGKEPDVFVEATTLHVLPRRVHLRPCTTVSDEGITHVVKPNAPTRPGMPVANLVTTHNCFNAAVTQTKPRGLPFTLSTLAGKNEKISELLSGHVNEFRHTMFQSNYGDTSIHICGDAA